MTRSLLRYVSLLTFIFVFTLLTPAQQRVEGGPPPEIKSHIDAIVTAFNSGDSDKWESMAQQHFSPAQLKRRTPEERKQMFQRLHSDFGTISLSRVEREGPDAPLQLFVKGSTGTEGVFMIDLESAAPYRVERIGARLGGPPDDETQSRFAPPPVNGKMSDAEMVSAFDTYFGKLSADDVFSGNVLIARDGRPVYQKSFGFADRANRIPNNAATRFNLGSINKTFTQTAIQQLVAAGKLSLTDALGKLIPDYPQEVTRAATVGQLLHHSAGVSDFFGETFSHSNKDRFRSNTDYFKFVSTQPPTFAPGTRTQYCNGCYIVLGEIIARVSGVPYEKYIADNIYKPAGMTSSGPLQLDAIVPNVAIGYTHHASEGELRSNILLHGASGSAAGGGYSTTTDLLAYSEALRHNRIPGTQTSDGMGIAGGAPGINSALEQNGPWTIIVMTNLDPPTGEQVTQAISGALSH